VISIAKASDIPLIPEQHATFIYVALVAATISGLYTYTRVVARVSSDSSRIRSDLFGFADAPVVGLLIAFFGLSAISSWFLAAPKADAAALKAEHIIPGALQFAVFPIGLMVFLYARNVSIIEAFGLSKVRIGRAAAWAFGLLLALLPSFFLITDLAARNLGESAELQPLVELYRTAVREHDYQVILHTFIAAAVIAPVAEEFLFRGYLYPTLKRTLGALPSAIFGAVLFAAIHNNAVSLPGLALLALALTVAYEWSGSLWVPIFMHAFFNGISLLIAAATAHQQL
jgi:membrane protease YdiL (CAAX protease family)